MSSQIIQNISQIAIFVAIILATFVLAYLANRFFKGLIRRASEELHNDPTNYLFLRHTIVSLIYIVGFSIAIYSLPSLRALANSLLAGAGILAVAVGFASQHALSNIISGAFVVVFKPFRVNDRISIRDMSGIIEDITLRHTVIRNFENKRIVIPNALISNEIIVNSDFEDGKILKWIDVSISYESDISLAKQILLDEILNHPLLIDGRTPRQLQEDVPMVRVRVILLGESGISLRGWAWAKDASDAFSMSCDIYESIVHKYAAAGIEIPYPHRTIVQKS